MSDTIKVTPELICMFEWVRKMQDSVKIDADKAYVTNGPVKTKDSMVSVDLLDPFPVKVVIKSVSNFLQVLKTIPSPVLSFDKNIIVVQSETKKNMKVRYVQGIDDPALVHCPSVKSIKTTETSFVLTPEMITQINDAATLMDLDYVSFSHHPEGVLINVAASKNGPRQTAKTPNDFNDIVPGNFLETQRPFMMTIEKLSLLPTKKSYSISLNEQSSIMKAEMLDTPINAVFSISGSVI